MQKDQQSNYEISILIEELKHEEVQVRLNAMRRIKDIAQALGPQRTRDDLLPYLKSCTDDEDEVLYVMAEQLGFFLPLVGGPEYSDKLLETLELISGIQEQYVRDEAVKSLITISKDFSNEEIEHYFLPLVLRLCHGEWFTSKISACGLLPYIYKQCDEEKRTNLRNTYKEFFNDYVPMIKRAAAANLDVFISVLEPKYASTEFFDFFVTLSNDDQDNIRILIIQIAIAYLKLFTPEDILSRLLPIILKLSSDESWRVRWSVANVLHTLFELMPPKGVPSLISIFLALLSDLEDEVKAAVSTHVTTVCTYMDKDAVINDVLPKLMNLIQDPCEHVRHAIAKDILGLSSQLGKEDTMKYILPMFNILLQDSSSDVRLLMISNLNSISEVIGVDAISDTIIHCIYALSTDKKWRVRLAILNYLPVLAEHLQQDYFDEHLFSVLTDLLYDNISQIRETCCKHLLILKTLYGDEYIEKRVIPVLTKMLHSDKYLYRITALHALLVFAQNMSSDFILHFILPLVPDAARILFSSLPAISTEDPVPNVRFNAAKLLGEATLHLSEEEYTTQVYPLLEPLLSDVDPDVCSFARAACRS